MGSVEDTAPARRADPPLCTANIKCGTDRAGASADLHRVTGWRILNQGSAAHQQRPCRDDTIRWLGNRWSSAAEQYRKRQPAHDFIPFFLANNEGGRVLPEAIRNAKPDLVTQDQFPDRKNHENINDIFVQVESVERAATADQSQSSSTATSSIISAANLRDSKSPAQGKSYGTKK